MKIPDINFEMGDLIFKSLKGTLSPEESDRLDQWVVESKDNEEFLKRLIDEDDVANKIKSWEERDTAFYWERLKTEIDRRHTIRFPVFRYKVRKYAAVLLPLLIIGAAAGYLLLNKLHRAHKDSEKQAVVSILPKGNTARLVLGNGQVVKLGDSTTKSITEKDGTKVSNSGSRLHYKKGPNNFEKVVYNTLYTPRGGEYQVVLSDGTKVWLNAASSLRYPTRFKGEQRKVYLSGEGYFEVTKDEDKPFFVDAGGASVEVLGTRFNIRSYPDDGKKNITLVEGAVRVLQENEDQNSVVLHPGFQAQLMENAKNIKVQKTNIETVLAWKNGLFVFDGESLADIMKKLTRWYDVDVEYEKGTDTLHFRGRVKKYQDIRGVLRFIEMTRKVRFTIEGRHVYVHSVV